MENIRRVTTHLGSKLAGKRDFTRRALTLIPTREGGVFHRDEDGNYWRAYFFIEKARTYETLETPEQAFEARRPSDNSSGC